MCKMVLSFMLINLVVFLSLFFGVLLTFFACEELSELKTHIFLFVKILNVIIIFLFFYFVETILGVVLFFLSLLFLLINHLYYSYHFKFNKDIVFNYFYYDEAFIFYNVYFLFSVLTVYLYCNSLITMIIFSIIFSIYSILIGTLESFTYISKYYKRPMTTETVFSNNLKFRTLKYIFKRYANFLILIIYFTLLFYF